MGSNSRGGGDGAYRNPCITMHQPWASLLVHGIKRIEGRSWPAPLTGHLWIHAAGKVPDPDTVKAMEDFYRNIYAVDGITDINFPEHYPVSRLLGCVEVVGCVRSEELLCWEEVPESVRLEALTDFCWLCEQPQKLVVPFEMRGYQRVYNLERKIVEAAIRGLCPVTGPLPVRFPLPDPHDASSLKQGSLASSTSEASTLQKSASLVAAIAGAQAAAMQFSKRNQTGNFFEKDQTGNSRPVHVSPFHTAAAHSKEIYQSRNTATIHPCFVQNGLSISKEVDPSRITTFVCSSSVHSGSANSTKIHGVERPTEDDWRPSGHSNAMHNLSQKSDMHLDDGCQDNKCKKLPVQQFGGVGGSHFRAPSKLFTAAVKEIRLR